MPIPTPFHPRTGQLSMNHEWRNWSGYLAAALYEPFHEREYYSIRSSAGLIDVSPLYKYELRGPDALRLADRIMTRDITRCAVGQVMYSPWCDDDGKVIDDGTIARLGADRLRITAAESNLVWFQDCGYGMDVQVEDVSDQLAALALQGPNARKILQAALPDCPLEGLKYYHLLETKARLSTAANVPLQISRTGYTGDLGYELWMAPEHAVQIWDWLMEYGEGYGITPAGMLALDIVRIEAGLIMLQVDYLSARTALIESQKSSPYEIGLGWAVDLRKKAFVGCKALLLEKENGSAWQLTGIEVDWSAIERLYGSVDLAPSLAGRASRAAVPIYQGEQQVGQMTSHTFSPLLKKYIGIGSLENRLFKPSRPLSVEMTIEYVHHKAQARLVEMPCFNPSRKRV